MKPILIQVKRFETSLFLSENSSSLIYLIPPEPISGLEDLSEIYHTSLAVINGVNWTSDLSPWPAPQVFTAEGDFHGQAAPFLKQLEEEVMPAVEKALPRPPEKRFMTGLSLSGLFALYCGYHSFLFDGLGSFSGSLWFDHWTDYMASHTMNPRVQRVYISLGRKEKRTRNRRMRQVQKESEKAASILSSQGMETLLELLPGDHFQNYEERMERMVSWLLTGTARCRNAACHP